MNFVQSLIQTQRPRLGNQDLKHAKTFILTKWMVSSFVLPSKSCTLFLCVFTKTISNHRVFFLCLYRYWSLFIILSYSYLNLPEKQSSSAVTWASPGCHVFLKGCLRGTFQIEIYSSHLPYVVPYFIFSHKFCLQSTSSQKKNSFIFLPLSLFFAILPCCVVR